MGANAKSMTRFSEMFKTIKTFNNDKTRRGYGKTGRARFSLTAMIAVAAMLTADFTAEAENVPSRYSLDVHDFTELKVSNGLNVDYVCSTDSAGTATFEAAEDLAGLIIFSNNDKGTLTIELDTNGFKYKGLPTVRVYSSFLNKVENSGDSLVRVLTVAPCPVFSARIVGNGRLSVRDIRATTVNAKISTGKGQLVINGSCDQANLNNTGTGSIQADGLTANKVKASILGTGPIGCSAKEQLGVQGMGSGKVYYRSEYEPAIKNRAIGVKVLPIEKGE